MRDLNYFPLNVESNIYGMTALEFADGSSKLLVATTECQVYCISYSKFKPHTREVEFTYIPNGARITSVGSLKRGNNDFAIGITHCLTPSLQKGSNRTSTGYSSREAEYGRIASPVFYLNIYASASASSTFDLDHVAQGCQTIRLRYTPYHLYQTDLVSYDSGTLKRCPYWLLSGSDNSIHAFCEDKLNQNFTEKQLKDCFPELDKIAGLALWIDAKTREEQNPSIGETAFMRAIVLGLEDGSVKLYCSSLQYGCDKFELIRVSSFDCYSTIIPSVRLFKVNSTSEGKLRNQLRESSILKESPYANLDQLNLLVVSSTNPCLIFTDILNHNLDCKYELPQSQRLDCTVTSTIGDINLDGCNEILLGTHGRELLTYQYDAAKRTYKLTDVYELNYPLYAMSLLNLTGDVLKELTILLASGIMVMQMSVKDVIEVCRHKLSALLTLTN